MNVENLFIYVYTNRLYTGPKDEYIFNVLSSPAYKKVMENNVDLELSFNDYDISKEKTLKEPKRAYFSHSLSRAKSNCQVYFDYTASSWTNDFHF